ncbi:hypothetical protein BD309DRAFT_954421 [Dichomitus squalens]|nr:hypothetical protein BD309DRAFT_954421 [Dichomitus squalens]
MFRSVVRVVPFTGGAAVAMVASTIQMHATIELSRVQQQQQQQQRSAVLASGPAVSVLLRWSSKPPPLFFAAWALEATQARERAQMAVLVRCNVEAGPAPVKA